MSQQPLDAPALRVVEITQGGKRVPFPTLDWADGPAEGEVGIASIIGVHSDRQGVVWMLDMGSQDSAPKLVGWDTRSDSLKKVIPLGGDSVLPISFLQDFVIDERRGKIYIADMTFTAPASHMKPAFVVVDIASGKTRRVLQSDERLMPVAHDMVINGRLMAGDGDGEGEQSGEPKPWYLGLNAIAFDPAEDVVYFGGVNGSDIYRLPAAELADDTATEAELSRAITHYATKRPNDGFIFDASRGGIIAGDVEHNALTFSSPEGMSVIAQDDERLRWPDGFAFAPDGSLYLTTNQLNAHPALNQGVDGSDKHYYLLKLTPAN
ncbi:L-dopachrome tautomerase-related protein [Cobetia marina]|uniref:L-dopachrome tautomerase-related protein n=1 Tax=Cobetia marina TaxID=28258 RepID=UPI00384C3C11